MRKAKFVAAMILLSLMITAVLCSCSEKKDDSVDTTVALENESIPADFTVEVKSQGGLPLCDVDVFVYRDEAKADLVWADHTDDNGKIGFKGMKGETYFVFLEKIPEGYDVKTFYEINETESLITISTALLDEESAEGNVFGLGDVMFDFTVTDHNGETYTLSELLKTKKAVVLNFWYHNCSPCMMEFPYLQSAYETAPESLELLALNYTDATEGSLSKFAEEEGYTMPFVLAEDDWGKRLNITSSPTTIVIDRFGTIAMVHRGYINKEGEFEKIFEYFTSEDYTQTIVWDIEEIA